MKDLTIKPIKAGKLFSKVFINGKKFYHHSASVSVLFYSQDLDVIINEVGKEIYYGISIGKKASKSAVVRNRIKRLIRVSLRELLREFNFDKEYCPIQYIVITWKVAPLHSKLIRLEDVKQVLSDLLEMSLKYYRKK
jgi:ribonuclease P protein component